MPEPIYHGTRLADALLMQDHDTPGQGIDVSRGSGELGQGFYAQDSPANAMTWVQNRFPADQHPCILKIVLCDTAYSRLQVKKLDAKKARSLTNRLRNSGKTSTYTDGADVLAGPLGKGNQQYKFESKKAQLALNDDCVKKEIIV